MRLSSAAAVILLGGVFGLRAGLGCGSTHATPPDAGPDSDPDVIAKPDAPEAGPDAPPRVGKIEHIVFVMQENRSFDHYFGMFPGADGFTLDSKGKPTNSNPDPNLSGKLVKAFHLPEDSNSGGSHDNIAFTTCFNGGKMDGFIQSAETSTMGCADPETPTCTNGMLVDAMGYKTDQEIPNYWAYAKAFTLQDRLFEDIATWSWPEHQFVVSAWAANCASSDPKSCVVRSNDDQAPQQDSGVYFSWTPLTYLLDKSKVSWKYYLSEGTAPDCETGKQNCPPTSLLPLQPVPTIWNPLPFFEVITAKNEQVTNVVDFNAFYKDVKAGTLPQVSWLVPNHDVSEHPPSLVSEGQAFSTAIINTIMQDETLWSTTVIFLYWDDWGGFYDHVPPPAAADSYGFGFRTPGIILSPWVKPHHIDHEAATFDAFTKFIEDTFLSGQRLDPKTDGRPDPRSVVRENLPQTGDLRLDFDFTQKPNKPLVLKPM
jgi:phospholipase C